MKKIAPSILSADFGHLAEQIHAAEKCGAEYLHFDVMDGLFVPSISFGQPVLKSIRPLSDMFYDVHLMVQDPGRYIEDFAKAGADGITVHAEAVLHLDRVLDQIRACGCKTGVAVNPATPLNVLEYVCEKIDMILIMTVNPGFGGQKLVPATLKKVRKLREYLTREGLDILIEVDGGIDRNTIRSAADAGADVIVSGSSVFLGNVAENYAALTQALM